jgi:hypothetical protein
MKAMHAALDPSKNLPIVLFISANLPRPRADGLTSLSRAGRIKLQMNIACQVP